jgi:hypothetical protein
LGVEGRNGFGWVGGGGRLRVGEEIFAEIAFCDRTADGECLGSDAEGLQMQGDLAHCYSLSVEEVAPVLAGHCAQGVDELGRGKAVHGGSSEDLSDVAE